MIGDNIDDIRRQDRENRAHMIKMARERYADASRKALLRHGVEKVKKEIDLLTMAVRGSREITDSTITVNIQFIDTVNFIFSTLPIKFGADILKRKDFLETCEIIYAIRQYMIDEVRKKAEDQLSTSGLDNTEKQA